MVRWNGANRTTTFVSSTQLQAAIPASDIATAGTAQVTVFNPPPGGNTSNALTFNVNPRQFTLTVNKAGTGSGTVTSDPPGINCDSTCPSVSASYTIGTVVELTGAPDSGSFVAPWSGGGCSGTNPCTVTMNSDITVTATFDLPSSS